MKNKKGNKYSGSDVIGAGKGSFTLGAVREKFDGLRNVASKLPDGKQKNSILTMIEETYVPIANWFQELTAGEAPDAA